MSDENTTKNNETLRVTPLPKRKFGGAQPGAGRKKGQTSDETKLRNRALRNYRVRVTKLTDKLLNSQLNLALGVSYLYKTIKMYEGTKKEYEKHVLVTDPEEILAYFNEETDSDQYYYITTKQPDVRAIRDIMEFTYGRPQQNVDVSSKGSEIKIVLGASAPGDNNSEEEANEAADNDTNS